MKRQTEELQSENELQRNSISPEPELDEHPIAQLVSSHAILQASVSVMLTTSHLPELYSVGCNFILFSTDSNMKMCWMRASERMR